MMRTPIGQIFQIVTLALSTVVIILLTLRVYELQGNNTVERSARLDKIITLHSEYPECEYHVAEEVLLDMLDMGIRDAQQACEAIMGGNLK